MIPTIPNARDAFVLVTVEIDGRFHRAYLNKCSVPVQHKEHFADVVRKLSLDVANAAVQDYADWSLK